MDNSTGAAGEDSGTGKKMWSTQWFWTAMVVIFTGLVLWRLFEWQMKGESLRGILSPLGMIFVGLGVLTRARNRRISVVFTAIALVLVLTGLALMFVY